MTPKVFRVEALAGLVVALALIPEAISFSILAGAAGPATVDQCSVDRASAVLGHLPRDTN